MDRKQLIEKYFQYSSQLTWSNAGYRKLVTDLCGWMEKADHTKHDRTTGLFSLQQETTAVIVSKQDGIVAGMEEIYGRFHGRDFLTMHPEHADGDDMHPGETVVCIHGPYDAILSLERTILNMLGRLSGIATYTHRCISLCRNAPHAPALAATRKTPWMHMDKKAVVLGGGLTHRLDLDSILIKDNHLDAVCKTQGFSSRDEAVVFSVKKAVASGRQFFEIEVNTPLQAEAAVDVFAREKKGGKNPVTMAIMLDNWHPKSAKQFMETFPHHPLYADILVEASGEVTIDTLAHWAHTGVDVLSMGALTHSTPSANLSLDFVQS